MKVYDIVTAARKPSTRSQMLKFIMPMFSGQGGKAIEKAVDTKDAKEFARIWRELGNSLRLDLEEQAKKMLPNSN